MSLLKVNEVQNYNGSSLTLTASTVSTSAQLNTGGNISVTGSLNVSDDSTTRSNLGLGSIATQDSSNVSVTGGSITGTTIVPTSPFTFRNRIINGDMRIDQRNGGASVGPFASASAGYKGVDRWFIATHTMTSQQITGNAPSSFSHYLKLTKGSGSNIDIRQTVELPAAGQAGEFYNGSSWTLSFYAKSASGGETLNFSSYFRQGIATGTFTSITAPSGVTLTTSWVRYEVVFTIDAAPSASDLCIAFAFNTTATELHLTGVMLEEGTVATPFEHRPISVELSLCQRYAYRYGGEILNDTYGARAGLYADGNQINFGPIEFPVNMRSTASMIPYGSGIRVKENGGAYTGWTVTLSSSTNSKQAFVNMSKSSHGVPVGVKTHLNFATPADYLIFQSEL